MYVHKDQKVGHSFFFSHHWISGRTCSRICSDRRYSMFFFPGHVPCVARSPPFFGDLYARTRLRCSACKEKMYVWKQNWWLRLCVLSVFCLCFVCVLSVFCPSIFACCVCVFVCVCMYYTHTHTHTHTNRAGITHMDCMTNARTPTPSRFNGTMN